MILMQPPKKMTQKGIQVIILGIANLCVVLCQNQYIYFEQKLTITQLLFSVYLYILGYSTEEKFRDVTLIYLILSLSTIFKFS